MTRKIGRRPSSGGVEAALQHLVDRGVVEELEGMKAGEVDILLSLPSLDRTVVCTPMSAEVLDLAERFFAAIQAGEIERLADMYTDDAVVWHNYDGAEQSKEDNLKVLGWLTGHTSGLRYEEVRRQATTEGFVQQHVLTTEFRGTPLEVPACIVATVREGRVARIDEYLDSNQISILLR